MTGRTSNCHEHKYFEAAQATAFDEPRFRPAYTLWNYVQWHSFGAPENLIWPNLANAGRLLILVCGLALFAALALGAKRAGPPLVSLALILLPPLLVVTSTQFGVDLARFGPQEPLLVGALMLGGSLLFLGCLALLSESGGPSGMQVALILGVGYLLWMLRRVPEGVICLCSHGHRCARTWEPTRA